MIHLLLSSVGTIIKILKKLFSLLVRINIYVGQIIKEKPQIKIPNQTTQRVMKEILAGKNVEEVTIEDLVSSH